MNITCKTTVCSIMAASAILAVAPAKANSTIPVLNGPFTLIYEVQEVDRRSDAEFEAYLRRTEAALRDARLTPKPSASEIAAHLEGRRMMRKSLLEGAKSRVTISSQGNDLLISQVPLSGAAEGSTYLLKAEGGFDLLETEGRQTLTVQPVPDISHLYLLPYIGTSLPRVRFFKGSPENGEILIRSRAETQNEWTYGQGTAKITNLANGNFVSQLVHKSPRGIFSKWEMNNPTQVAGVNIPGTLVHQTYSSLTAFQTPEPAHLQLYKLVSATTQSLPASEFSPDSRLKNGALIACSGDDAVGAFAYDSKKGTLKEQTEAHKGPFALCVKPEAKSINAVPALLSITFFSVAGMMVVSKFVIKQPSASSKD